MKGQAYRVLENTEALSDYIAIAQHIEGWTGDRALADRTVDAIRTYIRGLCSMPHRGTRRDDLRPGLRVVPFRKRTVVAFEIDESARIVRVLRVFYGGQDYESVIRSAPPA